jgi:SAM-dependent methyltransferase
MLSEHYLKTEEASHRYLAYRDLPKLIDKYLPREAGRRALDFGVGTGISAQFLGRLGFDVDGADISKSMLEQAQKIHPLMNCFLIEDGNVTTNSSQYDLIFSSFVLFELPDKPAIHAYLSEAKRLLKPGGIMIAVTGSELMHSAKSDWFIFGTKYTENEALVSGKKVKAYHYESGIEFTDYFWRDKDYEELFEEVDLHCLTKHSPLGDSHESYTWKGELRQSPFSIFVLENKDK